MKNLTIFLMFLAIGCGDDLRAFQSDDDDTDSDTDTGIEDAGLDTDTGSETETAGPVDLDTDSDTDTGSDDAGLDTDSETDTAIDDAGLDTDVDSDTDTETADEDAGLDTDTETSAALCPWECRDGDVDDLLTVCDSNTATPSIVHNYNFECAQKNYWCCQPLSAEEDGSIHESCAAQGENFSCQAPYNCAGIVNQNFYCGVSLFVCCET